jgi:hypothetical protein
MRHRRHSVNYAGVPFCFEQVKIATRALLSR